jgi:hypothetical protein
MTHPIRILGLVLVLGACADTPVGERAALEGGAECGAADYESYVGQRVDALNTVDLPESARVMFPTTPATTDFQAGRLNIAVDGADTITRVYCG